MPLNSEWMCSDVVSYYLLICHMRPNNGVEIGGMQKGRETKLPVAFRNLSFQSKPQLSFPELLLLTEVIHLTFF